MSNYKGNDITSCGYRHQETSIFTSIFVNDLARHKQRTSSLSSGGTTVCYRQPEETLWSRAVVLVIYL